MTITSVRLWTQSCIGTCSTKPMSRKREAYTIKKQIDKLSEERQNTRLTDKQKQAIASRLTDLRILLKKLR
jgi:hypothetical protein